MESALLTVPEAAAYLSIGKSRLWEHIRDGVIPAVRIGKSVRIPRSELDAYVRRLVAAAAS